jgi:hypothetical protein
MSYGAKYFYELKIGLKSEMKTWATKQGYIDIQTRGLLEMLHIWSYRVGLRSCLISFSTKWPQNYSVTSVKFHRYIYIFVCIPFYLQAVQIHSANGVKLDIWQINIL